MACVVRSGSHQVLVVRDCALRIQNYATLVIQIFNSMLMMRILIKIFLLLSIDNQNLVFRIFEQIVSILGATSQIISTFRQIFVHKFPTFNIFRLLNELIDRSLNIRLDVELLFIAIDECRAVIFLHFICFEASNLIHIHLIFLAILLALVAQEYSF